MTDMLYFKLSEAWFAMFQSYLECYKTMTGCNDSNCSKNIYVDGERRM